MGDTLAIINCSFDRNNVRVRVYTGIPGKDKLNADSVLNTTLMRTLRGLHGHGAS